MFLASISNAAVEITSFTASWPAGNNPVELSWQTGSEFNIGAFNVWRSTTNLEIGNDEQLVTPNDAVQVNTTAIPATCSGNTTATYPFTDTATLDTAVTYYYYIEAVRCQTSGVGYYGDGQPANPSGNGLEVVNGNQQSTATPLPTNTPTNTPVATLTSVPTNTPVTTNTPIGATATPIGATATPIGATATPIGATATPIGATATPTTPSGSTLFLPITMK